MKIAMLVLTAFLSTSLLAGSKALSYKDSIVLKKTVMKNVLPAEFINLHRIVHFEDRRMIAGKFETSQHRPEKKTYLDSLRSKLQGCKELNRF